MLIGLGVWQLQRMNWKRDEIARWEAVSARDARPLEDVICGDGLGAYGEPVLPTETLRGQVVRYYGARGDGAPGWRLLRLTPLPACGGGEAPEPRYVFLQTGFETLRGEVTGLAARYAVAPPPEANIFTPANTAGENAFYRFDAAAMAAVAGVDPAAVAADAWLAPAGGLPPGLADMPPARHLGYALTWFGLALTLVGVYVAYHLTPRRTPPED
jgi:surfeit locus 1 family protein